MGKIARKDWKFGLLLLIVLFAAALVVSACSSATDSGSEPDEGNGAGEASEESDSTTETGDGEGTTITFWHGTTQNTEEALEQIVSDFEAEHTDIQVELTYVGGDGTGANERLLAATASGNPPDVAYFDRFEIGSWAHQNSLTNLTEYAERDGITGEGIYEFAWDEASYEGSLYGVPVDTDSRVVLYNKDHFEEAGLDPDNPPTTIDELTEAAERLTIRDGNRYERIGLIPWHNQGWLYSWGWAFGGEFYDEETGEVTANHPQNVEALQWMADFAAEYNIDHITSFSDAMGENEMDPFIIEQLSMQVTVPATVYQVENYNPDLNLGAFPIPTPTGENHTTWSGGWSLVVPEGAENPDEAWEFLKYMITEEAQTTFAETVGNFSVLESVNDEVGFSDHPVFGVFVDVLPVSNNRPVISEGSLLWNELADAMEGGYRGNADPQEALDRATQRVNEALGN